MKRFLSIIFCIVIISSLSLDVKAHSALLEVEYDDCSKSDYVNENNIGDGIDERWYYLCERNYSTDVMLYYYHLAQNKKTLKYYFSPTGKDNTSYTWTTDVDQATANEIKEAFANSMKQWNEVYFYSYSQNGTRIKNKVINIEEGTANNYDIIIYPGSTGDNIAETDTIDNATNISTGEWNIKHKHYYKYYITVNISFFYLNSSERLSQGEIEVLKKRTGAHEVGHILGLDDIDTCCQVGNSNHHEELLMGMKI